MCEMEIQDTSALERTKKPPGIVSTVVKAVRHKSGDHRSSDHCPVEGCEDQCTCVNFKNDCLSDYGSGYYIIKQSDQFHPVSRPDLKKFPAHSWFLEQTTGHRQIRWEAWESIEPYGIRVNLAWLRQPRVAA